MPDKYSEYRVIKILGANESMTAWGFEGRECSGIFSVLHVWEEGVGHDAVQLQGV